MNVMWEVIRYFKFWTKNILSIQIHVAIGNQDYCQMHYCTVLLTLTCSNCNQLYQSVFSYVYIQTTIIDLN